MIICFIHHMLAFYSSVACVFTLNSQQALLQVENLNCSYKVCSPRVPWCVRACVGLQNETLLLVQKSQLPLLFILLLPRIMFVHCTLFNLYVFQYVTLTAFFLRRRWRRQQQQQQQQPQQQSLNYVVWMHVGRKWCFIELRLCLK
jgi:hypothetical protein